MFATAAGYCFAAETIVPQVVTSQVFYDEGELNNTDFYQGPEHVVEESMQYEQNSIAVWPISGSDADVNVVQKDLPVNNDNIKIVSKIGDDLVVENNFNIGAGNRKASAAWSGGANMLHGAQLPAGFYNDCSSYAEMPLLNHEMLEDDGGAVLAVSRNSKANCTNFVSGVSGNDIINEPISEKPEIKVDDFADSENFDETNNEIKSWVVANGQTLRGVLKNWCDKEGWDLVWTTPREYPIEASAVFKGRFVDVSSALVRNFSRAAPIPYAKFYNGNRVLVVSTVEE